MAADVMKPMMGDGKDTTDLKINDLIAESGFRVSLVRQDGEEVVLDLGTRITRLPSNG